MTIEYIGYSKRSHYITNDVFESVINKCLNKSHYVLILINYTIYKYAKLKYVIQ